jgi:PKD repeat protein
MKTLILVPFVLLFKFSVAQNLVDNASFETYSLLPNGAGQWNYCTGWSNCNGTGSPDYFHENGTGIANLPNTFASYLFPYSGNAIMGFCPYYALNIPNFREYLSKPLTSALTPGTLYEVSFWITNGETSGEYGGQGIDKVSVAFTVGAPVQSGSAPMTGITPQWTTSTILYETAWQQITFQFTAAAAYNYITFGNFLNDANTNAQIFDVANNLVAYYYLDGVEVEIADVNSISAALGVSDSSICKNSCVSFSDLSINNPTSWQWLFPGANPAISTLQNPSFVCYDEPGVYDVTLIAGNGSDTDTLLLTGFITVNPDPVPVISINGNLLTSSIAQTYQWYYDGNLITGATNQTYSAQQTGDYSVIVTDANGCSGFAEIDLHLTQFNSPDTVICEKYCTDFYDVSVNDPVAWQWQFPGGIPSSSTNQHPMHICYNLPGTYDVILVTTGIFGSDTLTLSDYITVIATPPIPVVTQTGNTLTSSVAYSYQWQLNAVDIPGATNQSYTILQSGYYAVVTGNESGCISSSIILNILISGIEDATLQADYTIYPNPSNGSFHIELPAAVSPGSISLRIFNSIGQEVTSTTGLSGSSFPVSLLVEMNDVADGLYVIEIKTGSEYLRSKMVISKRE